MTHQTSIKTWIMAFRLRTLALSFSVIFMGSAVAYDEGHFDIGIFAVALLTTLFLQILSNISNDYGDAVSGVDFAGRVGPQRAVQSGELTSETMLKAMYLFATLALASGLLLLYISYDNLHFEGILAMLGVGVLAIAAAICYTVGRRPYGYHGLGDVSVFTFFGLVGVGGSYVLYSGTPSLSVVLPACAIGLLSMGVLNMNNMRDRRSDRRSGKRTLVVIMGTKWAIGYQIAIMSAAIAAMLAYVVIFGHAWQLLFIGATPLFIINMLIVWRRKFDYLDSQLKTISIGTLCMVILFTIGTFIASW